MKYGHPYDEEKFRYGNFPKKFGNSAGTFSGLPADVIDVVVDYLLRFLKDNRTVAEEEKEKMRLESKYFRRPSKIFGDSGFFDFYEKLKDGEFSGVLYLADKALRRVPEPVDIIVPRIGRMFLLEISANKITGSVSVYLYGNSSLLRISDHWCRENSEQKSDKIVLCDTIRNSVWKLSDFQIREIDGNLALAAGMIRLNDLEQRTDAQIAGTGSAAFPQVWNF